MIPFLRKGIGIILASFLLVFVYIWLNLIIVNKGYFLSAKETERDTLEKKNRGLKLEVSQLKSLDRIEEIAREKLGYIEPKENEIIWLKR